MPTGHESFVTARSPLPHREFCARLGIARDLEAWVICVRRAIGHLLAIPPSAIQPGDTWRDLLPVHPCDWEDLGVVLSLERLGVLFPSGNPKSCHASCPGDASGRTGPPPLHSANGPSGCPTTS